MYFDTKDFLNIFLNIRDLWMKTVSTYFDVDLPPQRRFVRKLCAINKIDVFRIENVHNYVASIFSTLSKGNLQALKIFKL